MFFEVDIVPTRPPEPSKGEKELEAPKVEWEYWNGRAWTPIQPEMRPSSVQTINESPTQFTGGGSFTVSIPTDMAPVEVNNRTGLWMRARLVSGAYGFKREVSYQGPDPDHPTEPDKQKTFRFTIVETVPPAVTAFHLGYTYRSPWEYPEHCITYNDFQFEVRSLEVRRPGGFFAPFRPVADTTPALYLGFDRPLPNDLISLYVDIRMSAHRRCCGRPGMGWPGASYRSPTRRPT